MLKGKACADPASAGGGEMREALVDAEGGGGSPTETLKVLLVDDEPSVLQNLADGLALLGFEVCVAGSAAAALERLGAEPAIGVVVTDIRMPGRDGLSLTQEVLGSRRSAAPVQVILITGHATIEDATSALRAGARDMLRKPFRLAEVASAVASALEAALAERRALRERAAEAQRLADLEIRRAELARRLDDALSRSQPPATAHAALRRHDITAISHALRTPLNTIAGGTAIITGDAARFLETGIGYVQEGLQDVIRAVELVEELCRVEVSPDAMTPEPLDLTALIAEALPSAEEHATARSVRLRIDAAPKPLTVVASRSTVETIISHSLAATIAAAPSGATVSASVDIAHMTGQDWAVATLLAASPEASPRPPAGDERRPPARALPHPQEDLHFVIAKRLAARIGGLVTAWNDDPQAIAVRIALPL